MKKLTAFMFSGFGGKLLPQSPADVLITDLQFLLQSLPTPFYDWHTNRLAWFLIENSNIWVLYFRLNSASHLLDIAHEIRYKRAQL